jgi:hypothetical protein
LVIVVTTVTWIILPSCPPLSVRRKAPEVLTGYLEAAIYDWLDRRQLEKDQETEVEKRVEIINSLHQLPVGVNTPLRIITP